MVFKTHIPQSALGQAIDFVYLNYADHYEARMVTLPMLHQEMVFNLGDVFEVENATQTYTTQGLTSWVSGLQTAPITTTSKGKHLTLGILFKPWGLYQVLGLNPSGASNNAIDGKFIFDSAIEEFIREQIGQSRDEDFLITFEQYLLKSFPLKTIRKEIIHSVDTIDAIEKQKGAFEKIVSELRLSSKTFINTFNTTIGLSPLQYVQLKRVNKALALIRKYPHKTLTEIAYELGFFDQAHFIRVFKSFCGITPKKYRSLGNMKG